MESRTDAIRHLALVIHAMRPEWDTGGIRTILGRDSRPLPELAAVAMAVAADRTARTPAVINAKDLPVPGIDPRPGHHAQPPNAADILRAPKQPPDVAKRGAAMARAEMRRGDEW